MNELLRPIDIIDAGTAASDMGTPRSRAYNPVADGDVSPPAITHEQTTETGFEQAEPWARLAANVTIVATPLGFSSAAYAITEALHASPDVQTEAILAAGALGLLTAATARLGIIHRVVNGIANHFADDAQNFQ